MKHIIAFAGKKQSGKNTSANGIIGNTLKEKKIINGYAIGDDGLLYIPTDRPGEFAPCTTDIKPTNTSVLNEVLERDLHPIIKSYAIADELKQEIIKKFGVPWEQCYGSDEQKNMPLDFCWKDMMRGLNMNAMTFLKSSIGEGYREHRVTARQLMQVWGTEINRACYPDCWINLAISRIMSEPAKFALITDVRFPNEIHKLRERASETTTVHIVKLTRVISDDSHESETALDGQPDSLFDLVIENQDMSVREQVEHINLWFNDTFAL